MVPLGQDEEAPMVPLGQDEEEPLMVPLGQDEKPPMVPLGQDEEPPMAPLGQDEEEPPMVPLGQDEEPPMVPLGQDEEPPMAPLGYDEEEPLMVPLGYDEENGELTINECKEQQFKPDITQPASFEDISKAQEPIDVKNIFMPRKPFLRGSTPVRDVVVETTVEIETVCEYILEKDDGLSDESLEKTCGKEALVNAKGDQQDEEQKLEYEPFDGNKPVQEQQMQRSELNGDVSKDMLCSEQNPRLKSDTGDETTSKLPNTDGELQNKEEDILKLEDEQDRELATHEPDPQEITTDKDENTKLQLPTGVVSSNVMQSKAALNVFDNEVPKVDSISNKIHVDDALSVLEPMALTLQEDVSKEQESDAEINAADFVTSDAEEVDSLKLKFNPKELYLDSFPGAYSYNSVNVLSLLEHGDIHTSTSNVSVKHSDDDAIMVDSNKIYDKMSKTLSDIYQPSELKLDMSEKCQANAMDMGETFKFHYGGLNTLRALEVGDLYLLPEHNHTTPRSSPTEKAQRDLTPEVADKDDYETDQILKVTIENEETDHSQIVIAMEDNVNSNDETIEPRIKDHCDVDVHPSDTSSYSIEQSTESLGNDEEEANTSQVALEKEEDSPTVKSEFGKNSIGDHFDNFGQASSTSSDSSQRSRTSLRPMGMFYPQWMQQPVKTKTQSQVHLSPKDIVQSYKSGGRNRSLSRERDISDVEYDPDPRGYGTPEEEPVPFVLSQNAAFQGQILADSSDHAEINLDGTDDMIDKERISRKRSYDGKDSESEPEEMDKSSGNDNEKEDNKPKVNRKRKSSTAACEEESATLQNDIFEDASFRNDNEIDTSSADERKTINRKRRGSDIDDTDENESMSDVEEPKAEVNNKMNRKRKNSGTHPTDDEEDSRPEQNDASAVEETSHSLNNSAAEIKMPNRKRKSSESNHTGEESDLQDSLVHDDSEENEQTSFATSKPEEQAQADSDMTASAPNAQYHVQLESIERDALESHNLLISPKLIPDSVYDTFADKPTLTYSPEEESLGQCVRQAFGESIEEQAHPSENETTATSTQATAQGKAIERSLDFTTTPSNDGSLGEQTKVCRDGLWIFPASEEVNVQSSEIKIEPPEECSGQDDINYQSEESDQLFSLDTVKISPEISSKLLNREVTPESIGTASSHSSQMFEIHQYAGLEDDVPLVYSWDGVPMDSSCEILTPIDDEPQQLDLKGNNNYNLKVVTEDARSSKSEPIAEEIDIDKLLTCPRPGPKPNYKFLPREVTPEPVSWPANYEAVSVDHDENQNPELTSSNESQENVDYFMNEGVNMHEAVFGNSEPSYMEATNKAIIDAKSIADLSPTKAKELKNKRNNENRLQSSGSSEEINMKDKSLVTSVQPEEPYELNTVQAKEKPQVYTHIATHRPVETTPADFGQDVFMAATGQRKTVSELIDAVEQELMDDDEDDEELVAINAMQESQAFGDSDIDDQSPDDDDSRNQRWGQTSTGTGYMPATTNANQDPSSTQSGGMESWTAVFYGSGIATEMDPHMFQTEYSSQFSPSGDGNMTRYQ